ncbi:unnamed protein product [Rotaria sp. Silwood1]|nr:unnamed protein product [Rotaria sp. Silwood1]
MYMELIPDHIKTTLKVLVGSPSTRLVVDLLPKTLGNIQKIGKDCVMLSNKTHQTFVNVMGLLGEVISVAEVNRGLQETALRRTEIELNVSRVMQGELNKLGETIQSHYNDAKDAVRTAQAQYTKALKDIPTGFKALLLDFGRAIIGIVSAFGNRIANGQAGGKGGAVTNAVANGQSLAFARLYSDALGKLSEKVNDFLSFSSGKANFSSNPLEDFDAFRVTFEAFFGSLKAGGSGDLKTKISSLVQEGIDLSKDLVDIAKQTVGNGKSIESDVADSIKARLSSLISNVKPLVAAEAMGDASVPPATNSGAQSSSPTDSSNNEKFIAQMASERLRDAEKRYDAIFAQLKQQQEEMGKLMAKIASLDMTRINYIQILELLREALKLLSQVREQWNQLVLFFADIAARAEIALSGTLDPFIEQATQAGNAALSREERLFYVDLLKTQAINIHKQSYALFIMSRTYVDMSSQYMMQRLAGLSKMLTTSNDEERMRLIQELSNETKDAQDKVVALVNERRTTYTQTIQNRRQELEAFVTSLGGSESGDQKAIDGGKDILGLN